MNTQTLFLREISEGKTLTDEQAETAMHTLLRGEAPPEQVAGFLLGLRARGETVEELAGFTRVMREYAVKVNLDDPHAIDLCGTGGDGSGTFNISTAAGFVCAGAGVTVAKHGNRSVSSKAGSADVLQALGVNTELGKDGVERCMKEAGIAFMFAPFFHPAMKNVMPVRRALGVRTFFNILGPMCNPAGVSRQFVGCFDRDMARVMAEIMQRLGAEMVITAHGEDGLDEISLCALTTTFHAAAGNGSVRKETVRPDALGFNVQPPDALQGGDAEENAGIIRRILDGAPGPHRDVVLLNATYALYTSGKFETLFDCLEAARESITSGAARRSLEALVEVSNRV